MKFIKGLNKDAAPVDQPQGTYRYAKNVTIDESPGAISNEVGNRAAAFFKTTNERVIGSIVLTDDDVVFFTHEAGTPGFSRIYLFDSSQIGGNPLLLILQTQDGGVATSSITGLQNDVDLKFSIEYPIEGTYKIDPDENVIIYFTDNFNPPRCINITRQIGGNQFQVYNVDPANSPNKNYIDRLNLFPHSGPVPDIDFSSINNGGALKSGTYYLFLAYVDQNFVQTNFVAYSLGVPIVEDVESVLPIERYDGCPADSQTGKSITWNVTNLNTDYEFLRPAVVYKSINDEGDPAEFAFKLNDIDISSTTDTVTFSGLEGFESFSVDDVIIDTVSYDTAKTITQLDSILYLGNLTGTRDIGYQPFANNIKCTSVRPLITDFDIYELSSDNLDFGYLNSTPLNASKENGFRSVNMNSSKSFNRRGYTRDEVYALYIAFILNDGTMSYAYHIPGREALTGVSSQDVTHIGTAASSALSATVDELDSISTTDTDLDVLTGGEGSLFHFYDFTTATPRLMNFWQNRNEFYPNTNDYLVEDETGQIGDLRGENVRHHHMPTNSTKSAIGSGTGSLNANTTVVTQTYYCYFADIDNCGSTSAHTFIDVDTTFQGTVSGFIFNIIQNILPANAILNDDLSQAMGSGATVNVYIESGVTTLPIGSGTGTITGVGSNSGSDWSNVYLNGWGGNGLSWAQCSQTPNGIIWWTESTNVLVSSGDLNNNIRPCGIQLSDIKIPRTIADQVQGFKIYYAERDHGNRRVLGQDVIKNTNDIDNINTASCGAGSAGTGNEDFIVAPGSLYNGEINTGVFHDFYLLHAQSGQRKSLATATHTTYEYSVDMDTFVGASNFYPDAEFNSSGNTDVCLDPDAFVAIHMATQWTSNPTDQFIIYPLREKCRTYLQGDSIYDGRSLGFGKRIYNLAGESSILLGYDPNRLPNQGTWGDPNDNPLPSWHDTPPLSATSSSYNGGTDFPSVQVHNLHAFKTDMYLSVDSQELVWTGFEVVGKDLENFIFDGSSLNAASTYATGDIYGGDTYITRHGYRMTHRPEYEGEAPKDHKSLIYTICESSDNINFRHEEAKETAYFPGSPAKKVTDIEANIDLTSVDNIKYNKQYSLGVTDVKPPIPLPLREADPTVFKTRVQRSAKADNTSLIDNYRVFLALQFKDLPRNRGDLWKLVTFNNLLYLHTEDSLFRTKGKQSLKLSDGSESFIGSGDIFTQEPDEMVQTELGYGGTISQWVSLVSRNGYFCMDYANRRVFMVTDKMRDASKTGMENWFQDNIPFNFEQYGMPATMDNPIFGFGFHAEYDEKYDRILLTKRDINFNTDTANGDFIERILLAQIGATLNTTPATTARWNTRLKGFTVSTATTSTDYPVRDSNGNLDVNTYILDGWTASFSVEFNVWVSFHDYVPYHYSRVKTVLGSFGEGNLFFNPQFYLHDDEDNRGRFYGEVFESEFEFIYNASKNLDKVFYSFEYMIDVHNSTNVPNQETLLHDPGFTSFYVYTTHQLSGEQDIEYMINTRRVGNEWKINKFRDLALLQNNNLPIFTGPHTGGNFGIPGANVAGTVTTNVLAHQFINMFTISGMNETINNTFIDLNKQWNQQRKFTDKWVGIRLKYSNSTNKLIHLHSTDVAAKKFYR